MQSSKIINIGKWVYQKFKEKDGTETIINTIPVDAVTDEYEVEFSVGERYVLNACYLWSLKRSIRNLDSCVNICSCLPFY